ncbi:MAG: DNA polymerase III subunit epsilon [Candidatus Thioglobus sp.]|nr:MAG: DNA polymerase III subunit epsilon [Candidatus Thioglobus sp.]KAA0450381.1 MAG: DNA polymerase III subunit epsilon [Candidatus Thioglobus sp.]
MERLIVLDTETTGIEPEEGHRIIEIGCVEVVDRKIIKGGEYHQYIQPERLVGDSERIHGIKDSFLKDKPKFEEIAEEFLQYIEGATLVIHNAPFDLGFLNNELKLIGSEERIENNCTIIDSLELSKKQRPGGMHNLDTLCRRFEIDASERTVHGALLDAKILSQVYLAMTGGQFNLFGEKGSSQNDNIASAKIDSNRGAIKVIAATPAELKAHEAYFEYS